MADSVEENTTENDTTSEQQQEEQPEQTPASSSSAGEEDPDKALLLLPLHRKWILWYDNRRLINPEAQTTWEENLKKCGSFNTVERFWQVMNNVKPPSNLMVDSNYHVFREGVMPTWEDDENKEGGKLVLSMQKKDSKSGKLDEWWLYTVLAIVGELMDLSGDQVCGAVLSIRKNQDRIALWIKSSQKDKVVPIGERWKKALAVSNKIPLKFQLHRDAAATGTSFKNEVKFEI